MGSKAATPATLVRRECQAKFLAKLRGTGNVRASCKEAGINRATAYRWRTKYVKFRADWDEALQDACDILEAKAWTRAVEDDSDRVLMFLLKAHRRDLYGERMGVEVDLGDGARQIIREIVVERNGE